MALSKEWYDAEFVNSESESLHRAPSIEYSFYNAVKTGDMEYVIKKLQRRCIYTPRRNRCIIQKYFTEYQISLCCHNRHDHKILY